MRREHDLLSKDPARAEGEQRHASPARRREKTYLLGIYGMLAEILFSLGLILIGFAISLLCGW
jgi:hypothetical protein